MNITILKNFSNEIKYNWIRSRFDEALKNKQKQLLKKENEVKIINKTPEQKIQSIILKNFTILVKKVFFFFTCYAIMMLNAGYKAKQDETKQEERERGAARLKILPPK